MIPTRTLVVVAAAVLSVTAACRDRATPIPTDVPPTEAAVDQWPTLTVISPTVSFRTREEDEPVEKARGEEIVVEKAGANVIVGPSGHGRLTWPAFLTADLASSTDLLLGLSLPAQRNVQVDQGDGTSRYVLEGEGEDAAVEIKAAFASVLVEQGAADVLVSLVHGSEPAAWVVVLDGEARVGCGSDGDRVEVSSGQVVALTCQGPLPAPVDIDRAAVSSWFQALATGRSHGDITSVAFRCVVREAEAPLLQSPDPAAPPADLPLEPGELVAVTGRDEAATWVWVRPVDGGPDGWVLASTLRCVGPLSQLSAAAEETTATPTSAPTVANLPRPTVPTVLPLSSPTASATWTPAAGNYRIRFWAEDDEIVRGRCTVLRWETDGIREVYYQGRGVPGNGSSEECPKETKTYSLRVILRDGREETRTVEVDVEEPDEPTSAPATNTSPPTSAPPTDTQAPPTNTQPPPPSETPGVTSQPPAIARG